jgi:hypothetical protein
VTRKDKGGRIKLRIPVRSNDKFDGKREEQIMGS